MKRKTCRRRKGSPRIGHLWFCHKAGETILQPGSVPRAALGTQSSRLLILLPRIVLKQSGRLRTQGRSRYDTGWNLAIMAVSEQMKNIYAEVHWRGMLDGAQ